MNPSSTAPKPEVRSGLALGKLSDPREFRAALDVTDRDQDFLVRSLERMVLIRTAEEEIARLVLDKEARTPCHLGIGQEAIAVGVAAHLTSRDRVFGTHRSHSHYLAMGCDVYGLMAEVLGKADGASHGMGGSMHLHGGTHGFHGSVPIVAATIPIAVGAGLAARLDRTDSSGRLTSQPCDVAVSFFGDGASEEGVMHESLNIAAVFGIPVLFVCENNLYSSHLDILQRQPYDRIARFADAHGIPSITVDGNDLLAVADATAELLDQARRKPSPVFLEAVTYRWRGHVGPALDEDVGVRRSSKDLAAWMERDPIRRLCDGMKMQQLLGSSSLERIEADARHRIQVAVSKARSAAYPSQQQMLDLVYSDGTGEIS